MNRSVRRLLAAIATFAAIHVAALAGNVGPLMIQNYGADLDNPSLFWTNIGGGAAGKLGIGAGLSSSAGNLNVNTGTTGATIPLNNGGFTQSGPANFTASGTALTVTNGANLGSAVSGTRTAGNTLWNLAEGVTDQLTHYATVRFEFQSIAALEAFKPDVVTTALAWAGAPVVAHTAGYYAAGDGGGATYVWNSSYAGVIDGYFYVTPGGSASGAWVLQVSPEGLSVLQVGLHCDGTTDDAVTINNIGNAIQNNTGLNRQQQRLNFPAGVTCLFDSVPVQILNWQAWRGPSGAFNQWNTSTLPPPNIILNPASSGILLSNGAVLSDMRVSRKNLPAPTTMEILEAQLATWNDGSIGVKMNGTHDTVRDTQIIGFNYPLVSANASELIENVRVDGYNGVDASGSNDTSTLSDVDVVNLYSFNFNSTLAASGATIASGHAGTGYSASGTVIVSGGTCATQPTFSFVASGGVVSSVTLADTGQCTVVPTNPISVTGGGGTGLELTGTWTGGSNRPGLAFNFHEANSTVGGTTAFNVSHLSTTGWHQGLVVNNECLSINFEGINVEGGAYVNGALQDPGAFSIKTENCAIARMTDVYTTGPVLFDHTSGGVMAANLSIEFPQNWNSPSLQFGAGSTGIINGLTIGASSTTTYTATATATGAWKLSGVTLAPGTAEPWINLDAASAPLFNIDVGVNDDGISSTVYLPIGGALQGDGVPIISNAPTTGVFGISETIPGSAYLLSETANSSSIADIAGWEVTLPSSYLGGSNLTLTVNGNYVIGSGTVTSPQLYCGAYTLSNTGVFTQIGCNTSPAALTGTATDIPLTIVGSALSPGSRLFIRLEETLTETSGHAVTARINSVRMN